MRRPGRQHPSHTHTRRPDVVEPLESRLLLATISWTNRGSDGFGTYGPATANIARLIVDRACADWGRVISNFNYGEDEGNTFSVSISASNLGGTTRGSTSPTIGLTNGKPSSATITMDDNGGGGGWYFDQTVGTSTNPDDGEFTTLLTMFTATAPGTITGNDFYRTILHELGHALGISVGNGQASVPATNTGITDPNDNTNASQLWTYTGPSGTYSFTDNGGGHIFEGPAPASSPNMVTFPNDLMNAGRTVSPPPTTRQLITDADALLLRDAHGYSVNLPSTINTFLVNFNSTTGVVTLSEEPGTNDIASVSVSGANTSFTVNGLTEMVASASINSIAVNTGGGINNITLLSVPAGAPVSVTNTGVTNLNIGGAANGAQGILSPVTISNTSITTLFIDDENNSAGRTSTMDNTGVSASLNGLAPAGISWFQSAVINVLITAGKGNDNFTILRTSENVTYEGTNGNDTILLGNASNGVRSIAGDVTLRNTGSTNVITIDDTGDATGRTVVHDTIVHGVTSYGRVTGIAPGDIEYKYFDTFNVTIKTGNGVDTVNVLRTGKALALNSASGNDVVNVGGGAATDGVQNILAQLTIDNGPAFSVVTIDDTGNSDPKSVTIDESGGYNTVGGLAPAVIRFDDNDVSSATVRTGSGADTVVVVRNDEDGLVVTSSGGQDVVTIGSPAATGVQGITGDVTVNNPPSFTHLTISDSGDSSARTAFLDVLAGVTTITGLAPASIKYSNADMSATSGITLITGSGTDTVNVLRNGRLLKLTTTGGNDAIVIGHNVDGAQGITAEVNITNGPGLSSITVNDAASAIARTVTLASGSISGLSTGPITWTSADVSTVTINGGAGGNTFNSTGIADSTTLNTGAGPDSVNITPNASGTFTINGQGNTDAVTITDTDASAQIYSFTATSVARLGLTVNHSNIETLTVNASTAGDTFNVSGTIAGTSTILNPGAGTDTVNISETSPLSPVLLLPTPGNDDVTLNGDNVGTALLTLSATHNLGSLSVGNGGVVTLTAGGPKTLFVKSLNIHFVGRVDLTDNAMIIDPGPAAIATIRGYLQTGYNNGTWTGPGLLSSTAAADPQHIHGLAYAATADLGLNIYGGQFIGATSVLVKYGLFGDANISGKIDSDDYALADRGKAKNLAIWVAGDFNYDGQINDADYALLNQSANPSAAPASVADPDSAVLTSGSLLTPVPAPLSVDVPAPKTKPKSPAVHAKLGKKTKAKPKKTPPTPTTKAFNPPTPYHSARQ